MRNFWVCFVPAGFLLSAGVAVSPGQIMLTAVGLYNENTGETNSPDAEAVGNNITLAQFSNNVAIAFAADLGGVLNFDIANPGTTNSIVAAYGASSNQTLTITNGGGTAWNIATGGTGNSREISGDSRLGGANSGNHIFVFSSPLLGFGATVLSRSDAVRTVTATITFASGATVVFPVETLTNVVAGDDTFFGYEASPTNLITRVQLNGNSFMQIDDLGFYTAIPEPATLAMAALGLLVLGVCGRPKGRSGCV